MGFGREDRDAATLFGGPAAAGAAGLRARPAEPGADRRPVRGGRDDAVPVAAAGAGRRPPGGTAAAGRPGAAAGRRGPGRATPLGGGDERVDAGGIRRVLGGAHGRSGKHADGVPGPAQAGLGAQKTLRAAEQDRPDIVGGRAAWRTDLAEVDPARLLSLDESGIDTRLTRTNARAARGKRALGKVPWGHWRRLTVLAALTRDGVVACMSIAAPTSTAVFQAFVERVLASLARPARCH